MTARRLATLAALGLGLALALATGCGGRVPPPAPIRDGVQYGVASWYGGKHHGRPTASGERFNKRALTAAHRTLRFSTRVRVTNQRNGRSVVVRITDRGPYARGRIIDVSEAAAEQLGMIRAGIVPCRLEVLR